MADQQLEAIDRWNAHRLSRPEQRRGFGSVDEVDNQPMVIVTGTSPLSAEALCDAWDKFSNPKFSHERTGSEINHNADLFVSFRNSEDGTAVKMEAERKAGAKVTHVTISSPLPVPSPATELGN